MGIFKVKSEKGSVKTFKKFSYDRPFAHLEFELNVDSTIELDDMRECLEQAINDVQNVINEIVMEKNYE